MEDVIVTDLECPAEEAPEETGSAPAAQYAEVVDVQFRPGQKIYYFAPAGFPLEAGSHVIIDTARGPEFGYCASGIHRIRQKDIVAPLRQVLRIATAQDEKTIADNQAKEKRAFEICMQKIEDFKLDMQLVSAECAFDGSKILFFFTADERVDFRELVKSLASIFRTRIELRQIGVRDKAKMVGGLGICGRPFCCATFLDDFQPVSIKMAKTQNLSLNPTKISGTCGRLMCCLKYEQEAYEDLLKTVPKMDSFVDTPQGRGTVVDVNLLRQQVKVQMETQSDTLNVFPVSEIAVLRSGKARKNDPPIPADLAPISGSGKRPAAPAPAAEEESAVLLDPIRFKYSTESIAEETTAPAEVPEDQPATEVPQAPAAAEAQPPKPRRRRNPDGPKEPREPREPREARPPRPPREPKEVRADSPREPREPREPRPPRPERKSARPDIRPEGKDAQAPEGSQPGEDKKPRRRNNYRRPRKPRPQGGGEPKSE